MGKIVDFPRQRGNIIDLTQMLRPPERADIIDNDANYKERWEWLSEKYLKMLAMLAEACADNGESEAVKTFAASLLEIDSMDLFKEGEK
jgi:hypothetical protein